MYVSSVFDNCDLLIVSSSDKEQLVEEEDDELKEVLDLRKIAVQLLQQEQQNRCVVLTFLLADVPNKALGH